MSSVNEIQDAVSHLSKDDLAAFRQWFAEFDAALWDAQMEADVTAGRLDKFTEAALRDLGEGRCRCVKHRATPRFWACYRRLPEDNPAPSR